MNAPSDKHVRPTPLLRFCCSSALIVEHPAAVGSRPDVGVVNRKMERMPRSREVIDERFTIEQLAGFGGMGQIYRARDRRTGGGGALRGMHDPERLAPGRSPREAQVPAPLSHPGIVRYIDRGIPAEGEPYL